jgi:hypothetical protein
MGPAGEHPPCVRPAVNVALWRVGMRVRLARPDNPKHPRKGEVGTVVGLKEYAADPGYPKKGRPAMTLLWTRFSKATWDDWRSRKGTDDTFGLFDHEVEEER